MKCKGCTTETVIAGCPVHDKRISPFADLGCCLFVIVSPLVGFWVIVKFIKFVWEN